MRYYISFIYDKHKVLDICSSRLNQKTKARTVQRTFENTCHAMISSNSNRTSRLKHLEDMPLSLESIYNIKPGTYKLRIFEEHVHESIRKNVGIPTSIIDSRLCI
jgi:hypothetical protein